MNEGRNQLFKYLRRMLRCDVVSQVQGVIHISLNGLWIHVYRNHSSLHVLKIIIDSTDGFESRKPSW